MCYNVLHSTLSVSHNHCRRLPKTLLHHFGLSLENQIQLAPIVRLHCLTYCSVYGSIVKILWVHSLYGAVQLAHRVPSSWALASGGVVTRM